MVNLDALTLQELLEIQKQLPALIAQRQEEVRKDVLQKAAQLAARHGLTLEDLVSKSRKRRAVKYANPDDTSQTWSGVGSRPRWVRDHLARGFTLEDMKVKQEE